MTTAEIINQFNAEAGSERVIVVNGTSDKKEKVMDLTVETKKPRKKKEVVLKPEDTGKVVHELLPHLRLVCYTKGYNVLQTKRGNSWVGAVIWKSETEMLRDKLTELLPNTLEYDEANG
jgi:hypothetical protein